MDLYRSCPDCNYDLCLACCQELREGKLLGSKQVSVDLITEVQNEKLAIWIPQLVSSSYLGIVEHM